MNQLLILTQKIYLALENGKDVNLAFLDISKAFDKVWHTGLLHKLKTFGISGKLLDWLTSYLTERPQRVVFNGVNSEWILIEAGVPQGSTLGPLLFWIYAHDIIFDINSDIFLYADDTVLMRIVTDPVVDTTIMNSDLEQLNYWSKQWAVTFSPAKSEQLIITRKVVREMYAPLQMNGVDINRVMQHSHLGVVFTENLSWETHIQSRIQKSAPALNTLIRSSRFIPRAIKDTIYRSFIRPILEYGCMIYDNCPMYVSNRLEKTQRSAALACTGAYKDTSQVSLLKELGWPTMSKRREYYKLCQLYKIINNACPQYVVDSFPLNKPDMPYQLRNADNLLVPRTRTSIFRKSFLPSTIRLWNLLDNTVRNCISLSTFKIALKKVLFPSSNNLYSYGTGDAAVNLARMRMGLSALNQHRWKYNYIPDASCPTCGNRQESIIHYFLDCPTYHAPRVYLLQSVTNVAGHILPDIYHLQTRRAKESLIYILLHGDVRLDVASSKALIDSVHQYITATQRMTRRN